MRLHLMPDEKIINRTIELFEDVYPNENKYLILLWNKDRVGKYVQKKNNNIFFVNIRNENFWEILGDTLKYKSIIIHYLSTQSAKILTKINHPSIYWIEWGGDLYDTFLDFKGFKLYTNEKLIFKLINGNLPYIVYKFLKKIKRRNLIKLLSSAVKKIKYFVPDSMYDEYPLLLNYYPEFSFLEYKEFFYYPIDEILGKDLMNQKCCESTIIIGNSCSFTGNHLNVLEKLKKIEVENKIVVPLSYGGNAKYRNLIVNFGEKQFGTNFLALTEYLALKDYNNILIHAGFYIYGNLRQEAVGNILIALYLGGKVFLDKSNPLLNFYKNLGLIIFSLDELTKDALNERLCDEQVQINRKILIEQYSLSRLKMLVKSNF